MPGDDLTQQLAAVLARKAWEIRQDEERQPETGETEWLRFDDLGGSYRATLIRAQRPAARAVLMSGLVVPASDVLNLAQQWDDEYCTGSQAQIYGDLYAAELRALTQQEP